MDQRAYRTALADRDVIAKTGRSWEQWFEELDRAGALELERGAIARLLGDKYRVGPFWRRQVTAEYERARGRGVVGERKTGHAARVSRTIEADLEKLHAAVADARARRKWFPSGVVKVLATVEKKSLRASWGAAAHLDIAFRPRMDGKVQIAVQLSGLDHEEDIDRQRLLWKKALVKLEAMLID